MASLLTALLVAGVALAAPAADHLTTRDADGYAPIDHAMERGDREGTQRLLAHWAASDAAAALVLAAADGNLAQIDALLARGVAVDAANPSGYTALAMAARWGQLAASERLLRAGALVDRNTATRYGSTALMEASRDGHVAVARALFAAGAAVDQGDRYGDHALNWACYFGHAPFVALLLEHKPDLMRTGQTDDRPLEVALREKHAEVVALLRKAGAPPARAGKPGT